MVGKSATREEAWDLLVKEGIAQGHMSDCYLEWGYLEEEAPRVQKSWPEKERIFDLASLTKPLLTAPLAYRVLKETSFDLKLGDLIPQARLSPKLLQLKIGDLLAHEAGLQPWLNFWVNRLGPQRRDYAKDWHAHLEAVLRREQPFTGHKDFLYSDIGYLLLGYGLLQQRGLDLMTEYRSHFGSDPAFGFPAQLEGEFVRTAYCRVRERWLLGEVHDENAAALGGSGGHAGLFATGRGLGHQLRRMIKDPLLREYLVANGELLKSRTEGGLLGFRRADGPHTFEFAKGKGFGHTGFTGTLVAMEPQTWRYVILLTNRVLEGRRVPFIRGFRQKVLRLVREDA